MALPVPESAERRELTAFDLGCIVVGGIVGVGIFFTPTAVARAVDSPAQVVLAWSLGGLLAVLGALVFAELATLVPGHGGVFRWIHAAFGPLPAFLYGWANWLVIQAGALGIVALVLVDHLAKGLGVRPFDAFERVALAIALILAFTATNVVGLRVGKRVQNVLTVAKVGALGFVAVLALLAPERPPSPPPEPSGKGLLALLAGAILPVLFAIGGWQQGSFVAGAAVRPRRDVPLGILAGVAVVVAAYLGVNLAYLELLGFDGVRNSQAVGADAAAAALHETGGRVFAWMVVVSAAGIMNTICLAPPYVLYAMAQAGLFPAAFGRLHPRFHTPVLGVLGQGLWAAALLALVQVLARAGSDPLGAVCDGVVFVDWLFFACCGFALLRLRGRTAGALRIPGGAVAAVLFAAGAVAVTAGAIAARPGESATGAVLVAAGVPAWALLMRRRVRRGGGQEPTA